MSRRPAAASAGASSGRPLVVVGDILLDREVLGTVDRLCPEAPVPVLAQRRCFDRPGGAGLAALFAVPGDAAPWAWSEVILLGAIADDEAGDRLRELLKVSGVALVELPLLGGTPERIRLRSGAQLLLRLDRGGERAAVGDPRPEALDVLREAGAVLVSDYGRGVAAHPAVRRALACRAGDAPLVWDPHPRGGAPVPGADLVTPNRAEATAFVAGLDGPARGGAGSDGPARGGAGPDGPARGGAGSDGPARGGAGGGDPRDPDAAMAARLRRRWGARAVAVTLGDRGAALSCDDRPARLVPAPVAVAGDPCGAGDRLACAAVTALAGGSRIPDAVVAAVAVATAYVASGGAAAALPDGFPVGESATNERVFQ